MAVTISLPGALASYAESRRRLAIEPPFTTVGQALDQVWRLYPGLRDRVLTEEGAVRRHVNVFVGTESIRDTGGLGTPVVDGLELAIIPAVSGGAGESVRRTGRFSKPGTEWRVYSSSNDAAIAASRTNGGRIMQATTVQAPPEVVRAFVQEYFDAWKGTDEDKILAYYSDDVVIQLPTGTLEGKTAVRDNFVRPFIGAFPGNVHAIRNLAHETNLVAVEWSFEAMHTGPFANVQATGRQVRVPGCSFYEYDLSSKAITAGRIYFDLGTLLRQIGAAA